MSNSPYPHIDYPRQSDSIQTTSHSVKNDDMLSVSGPSGTVYLRSLPGGSSHSQKETHTQVVCQPDRCHPIFPQFWIRLCHPWNQRWLLWLCCQVSHYRQLWCVNEVCGMICAMVTWILILFAESVVLFVILGPVPSPIFRFYNGFIFHLFIILAAVSHLKAVFSDPGSIPFNNATQENIALMGLPDGQVIYRCPKCNCIKPARAHHCSVCRRCIRKMDHHCPWVNNCVGEMNQKYFCLFTFYIFLSSFYALYMGAHFLFICIRSEWEECSGAPDRLMGWWSAPSPGVSTLLLAFLIAECLIFGLFTLVMFSSQLYAICSDTTAIEQLKRDSGNKMKQSKWTSMERTFGSRLSWRWLSPCHPPLPPLDWYGDNRMTNVV